jgi:hypothetical protein
MIINCRTASDRLLVALGVMAQTKKNEEGKKTKKREKEKRGEPL